VENLNDCLAIFKRRLRHKHGTYISDSYTRVGRKHLKNQKSKTKKAQSNTETIEPEEKSYEVDPTERLQYQNSVLKSVLRERVAANEITPEQVSHTPSCFVVISLY